MRKSLDEFTHTDLLNLRLSNVDRPHVLELIEAVEADMPSLSLAPGLLCGEEPPRNGTLEDELAYYQSRSRVRDQRARLRHAAAPGQTRRQAHA